LAQDRAEYLAFVDTTMNESRVFFGVEAVSRLFLSNVSYERTGNLKSHTDRLSPRYKSVLRCSGMSHGMCLQESNSVA